MKLFDVYPLADIELTRAEGAWLWDTEGRRYLDMYGGHAVISIGHSHPLYTARIQEQLGRIGFYSNSVKIPQQAELAEKLGKLSGYENYQLFLCNSGAEANENALKLASFRTGRSRVVVLRNSFHGRTSAAVAATDNPAIRAPINSTGNFHFVPMDDSAALIAAMSDPVCAVMFEGIQGLSGIYEPAAEFLQLARRLCDEHGAVLIADEVQSGYGRTGMFFAHQHAGIKADLITVAKGMGNGFPVGGVLIAPDFPAKHGLLGTTFGGNHLACAAAIAVLDILRDEGLLENSARVGRHLIDGLRNMKRVRDVRGRGLMIGLELDEPSARMRSRLLAEHRIFAGSSSNTHTIRLLPPMNLSMEQADMFLSAFSSLTTETS